jgi:ABC-type enterochelin transport system permease subunit
MKEFLENLKHTFFILVLFAVAAIIMVFAFNLLERWFGFNSVIAILITMFFSQIYNMVKRARKEIDKEE